MLKVISLDTALSFYSGVLGLKEAARRDFGDGPMMLLSTGGSDPSLWRQDATLVAHSDPLQLRT